MSRAIKLLRDRVPDMREHFNRVISFSPFSHTRRVHTLARRSRNSDIWRVLSRRYARVRAGEKFIVERENRDD